MLNKKRLRRNKISNNTAFLSKLYDILNDEAYKDIILWNNEGKAILIKDINKLCEIVLPNYYKHSNYSSFIRQLNFYGFNKAKELLNEEICFEHNILNKNSTKEQIKEVDLKKKEMKNIYIKFNKMKEIINNLNDVNNKYYLYKYLLYKIEENESYIFELKNQIKNFKNINKVLFNNLQFLRTKLYGHSILMQKIINYKNNNNRLNEANELNISTSIKTKNIKDLFKKYLYLLHIYSPYVAIKGNIIEKVNSFKINSINNSSNNKK